MGTEFNSTQKKKHKSFGKKEHGKALPWRRKQNNKSEQNVIKGLQEQYDCIDSSKVKKFTDLPLSQKTLRGLKECGYLTPTEIQRESIGLSLRGLDILGAAKTGSGKTLAFLIPVLELLYCKQWTLLDGVGALIITPTRELAYQIFESLRKVGVYHDFSAGLIIGGKDLHFEKKRMDQCNIVICTPGRLLQHMDENPLFDCTSMKILVLDEADRCLDLGFEATMNNIIENLPPERQTLLFSATQTKSVRDLARLSLKDPMYVSVHEHAKHSTPESLQQSYVVCELHDKLNMLWSFIRNHLKHKILVFMSSCKQVKYMYEIFCRLRPGTTLLALYGTLHQLRRMEIYNSFCQKSHVVLFATDIAARGLDFPEVNWVVQLDCPEDANTYIHRAGRTARFQKGGESLLILLPSEEKGMVEELAAKKIPINKIKINPLKLLNPRVKIEAFVARDSNLKQSAQRAFVSYLKSVFLMKNKQIFSVKDLDMAAYSSSLGLAVPPRVRFLQKHQAGQQQIKQVAFDVLQPKAEQRPFSFANDDSDDDILRMKRKDHELEADAELEGLQDEPVLSVNGKAKKAVTKVSVAKRILKKNLVVNKKTVFNEEGKAVLNPMREKVSEAARQYETEVQSGIDIEEAKQMLREEDVHDKKRFREKVKAEHRKQKLKQKALDKEKEQDNEEINGEEEEKEEEEEGSDEASLPDLSWLPDPDVVYPNSSRNSNSEEDDNEEEEEEDEEEEEEEDNNKGSSDDSDSEEEEEDEDNDKPTYSYSKKPVKRKGSELGMTRKRARVYETVDTGLSLEEDEELALQILKSYK